MTHPKDAPHGEHVWVNIERAGVIVRRFCDVCEVTPAEWLQLTEVGDSPTVNEPRTNEAAERLSNRLAGDTRWLIVLRDALRAERELGRAEAAQPIDVPTISALLMEAELNDLMGPDYDPDRLAAYLVARLRASDTDQDSYGGDTFHVHSVLSDREEG